MQLILCETDIQNEAASRLWAQCREESGADPFSRDDRASWLIYDEGQVVGVVGAHAFDWVARRCRGAAYVMPGSRKRGVGRWAVAERNRILFESYNIRRIEFATEETNVAAMRMVESLRAEREGWLRHSGYRNGQYVSHAIYAWVRED